MNLKELINKDFVTAYKAKDDKTKNSLGMLKTQITNFEKTNGNIEATDENVLSVVTSVIKQREKSSEAYVAAGRQDLADNELLEANLYKKYLPAQMSRTELEGVVYLTMEANNLLTETNINKKQGAAMGFLNKLYKGRFDQKMAMEIIKSL